MSGLLVFQHVYRGWQLEAVEIPEEGALAGDQGGLHGVLRIGSREEDAGR